MSENKENEASKGSWFKGLQAEFLKIKWPDGISLTKQTVAVIVVTVILGIIIVVVDLGIQNGVDVLTNL